MTATISEANIWATQTLGLFKVLQRNISTTNIELEKFVGSDVGYFTDLMTESDPVNVHTWSTWQSIERNVLELQSLQRNLDHVRTDLEDFRKQIELWLAIHQSQTVSIQQGLDSRSLRIFAMLFVFVPISLSAGVHSMGSSAIPSAKPPSFLLTACIITFSLFIISVTIHAAKRWGQRICVSLVRSVQDNVLVLWRKRDDDHDDGVELRTFH
ncbi:hypothetical protein EDB81DRAFT_880383 [Dactylonectria macrodidyma]|uniref:Uncharacterized protein n=1 Tax=Dactylonectria macrodidyma TaxID=307937 RepID=A0A9P9JFF2_9HYPO|nr:hypothetical protein EDB81DRAFT_880383 [Dactylonectria macrodidyma]